jgi:hypothetical protein
MIVPDKWSGFVCIQFTLVVYAAQVMLRLLQSGLGWSVFQTPFCLRQQGTFYFICISIFARRAKIEIQKQGKVPLRVTVFGFR